MSSRLYIYIDLNIIMAILRVNRKEGNIKKDINLYYEIFSGRKDSIIILVHGRIGILSGGTNFFKTAKKLNRDTGWTTTAFYFSGCGKSDDDTITIEKEVQELKYVINNLKSKYKEIGLIGMSLGGLICLKCYSPVINKIALWAPVTHSRNPERTYSKFSEYEKDKVGNIIVPIPENKIREMGRKCSILDKKYFNEIGMINTEELLNSVKCPILLIHGTADEQINYRISQRAKQIKPSIEFKSIIGGTHNFYKHSEFYNYTQDWFRNTR